ncbi:MAG: extracellular solute-binding protein, partial [Actinobacteria bacterium]|nr:extracellular solute-binding protein [Actinomycetota bacterium]
MRAPRILVAVLAVTALAGAACSDANQTAEADPTTPAELEADDATPTETEEAEAETIRYFTFSAAPDHLETLDAMIAAFNEQHPEITVEVETAPYEDYFTKLQTQLAGGDAPDAFEVNYENFVSFAAKGALADLDTLSAQDPGFDASTYYDRAYEAFQLEGTQYGLPASYSTVVTFYNKDLFDAAGVAHPTADWTWEDEKAAAEQLSQESEDVWGHFGGIQFWEFYKTAAQNGCEFFTGDEVTVDAPACVEA